MSHRLTRSCTAVAVAVAIDCRISQGILIEFLEGRGHFASVVGISSADGRDPADHVAQVTHLACLSLRLFVGRNICFVIINFGSSAYFFTYWS